VRVNLVFVKPEFRRCGVGSALARHLIERHGRQKIDWGRVMNDGGMETIPSLFAKALGLTSHRG
jgi:GNAT superfamily N-acetyltransferase